FTEISRNILHLIQVGMGKGYHCPMAGSVGRYPAIYPWIGAKIPWDTPFLPVDRACNQGQRANSVQVTIFWRGRKGSIWTSAKRKSRMGSGLDFPSGQSRESNPKQRNVVVDPMPKNGDRGLRKGP